jgi:Histidine kinase-, DNA gyrase B-, and HSP90-like ATPase
MGSLYVNLVPTLTLLAAFLFLEEAGAAIVSGIICMLGSFVLVHAEPADRIFAWEAMVGTAAFFGTYGASRFRRALEAHRVGLARGAAHRGQRPRLPPEVLPHLFEAFFTTKDPEKGTGLGLSISRELLERFGGTLHAENRPEGGARLRIELPMHVPQ